jgi:hypothetical protein
MLRRIGFAVALAFTLVAFAPSSADAQVSFGPRVGIPFGDIGDDFIEGGAGGTFLIGVEARFSGPGLPLELRPSADFYFQDAPDAVDASLFVVGVDGLFPFVIENPVFTPYTGGGLRLIRSSFEDLDVDESETNFGLGVVFGAKFQAAPITPFVELGFDLFFNAQDGANVQDESDEESLTGVTIKGGILF